MAPLEVAGSGQFADRLNPAVTIDDRQFVLIAQELVTVRQELVTVRKSVRGAAHGSLGHERDHIIAALDMLFAGL
ncbi:MAG TPA: CcdB family protein [Xanthobacteraceae bacterium]|nr:CcdB family protein [Xanthobacteraceae bacterium]